MVTKRTPRPNRTANARTQKEFTGLIAIEWRKAVESPIATGRLLNEAKVELDHGEFLTMIEDKLPFGARTAQMLMEIAKHPIIGNAKYISYLPASWGTLYDLTRLSDRELKECFAQGLITPELKRSEVSGLVQKLIDDGTDSNLLWLPSRLNTLIGYVEKWSDVRAAVEQLWAIREEAQDYVKEREPALGYRGKKLDLESLPTRGCPKGGIEELITLTQWLTKLHDHLKRKLKKEEEEKDADRRQALPTRSGVRLRDGLPLRDLEEEY